MHKKSLILNIILFLITAGIVMVDVPFGDDAFQFLTTNQIRDG